MAKKEKKVFSTKFYHIILVRYYWFLIIFIILIAFLVEYALIIKPKVLQASNGGPLDVGTQAEILEEQEIYLERLKQLKIEADKIDKDDLKKLDYVVAEKAEMPALLNQINVLSEQSGLELGGFGVEFGQGIITTTLGFGGGTYQTVKQYLEYLEKNIRIMDVTDISLQDIGNNLSLSIDSYYVGD